MNSSKKRECINILFDKKWKMEPNSDILHFSNEELKKVTQKLGFMNQFDAVKYDTYDNLPEKLKEHGYFIVHLGKGNHAFVKGNGFHDFEEISETKKIEVYKSLIDDVGDSEAGTVSFLYNEGIVQDFLQDNDIKVHTARRSKVSFDFKIKNKILHADKQQIEIDGIFETNNGKILAVEVKNIEHKDFEIRQLFAIKKYFDMLQEKEEIPRTIDLKMVFIVRIKKKNIIRLYEYEFLDDLDMNSIKFIKSVEYELIEKSK